MAATTGWALRPRDGEIDFPEGDLDGAISAFMHRQDELYNSLRGPAKNVTVLASALSPKEMGGSGEEEPLVMAISFGKGRVVHDALGHGAEAVHCVA